MEAPDWYPEWRHEAVHELQDKNDRLAREYRIGQWPRWDYDLDSGQLIFSEDGQPKVVARIQVAGTTSMKAGNWLWAWANAHWPDERTLYTQTVYDFGEKHGICELTHETVEDEALNDLGWALTAVAARVTGAAGAYRPPRDEGGGLFLLYENVRWVG